MVSMQILGSITEPIMFLGNYVITCAKYIDKLTTIAYKINLDVTNSAACNYKARK